MIGVKPNCYVSGCIRRPHDPECRIGAEDVDTDDDADEACLAGCAAFSIDCSHGGQQLVFCLSRSPLCCRLDELDRWLMVCNMSPVRQKVGSLPRCVPLHNSDPGPLILVHGDLSAVPSAVASRLLIESRAKLVLLLN